MSPNTVVVNGATVEVEAGATIATLLTRMGRSGDGVAAAVNGAIVLRTEWTVRVLGEGDQVELLTAVQGG